MLPPRQARFVEEYLVDLNGKQAAIRAGYSAATAEVTASKLLRSTKVSAALQAAKAKRSARTEITADAVLAELARIAFADPRAVVQWGPDGVYPRPSSELTDAEAAIVSEVSQGKDGLKIKLVSKIDALGKLGQHLGLFKDRVEVSGPEGGPVQIEDVSPREQIESRLARLAAAGGSGGGS